MTEAAEGEERNIDTLQKNSAVNTDYIGQRA